MVEYNPNITETERLIIETLSLNGAPMTPYQIKEKIDRSYAGVAKMCKQLEERGCLTSKRSETIRKSIKIEYWFTVSGGFLAFKTIYEKSLEHHIVENKNPVTATCIDANGNECVIQDNDPHEYYTLSNCDMIMTVLNNFSNMDVIFRIIHDTLNTFLELMPNKKDKEHNLIDLLKPFIESINLQLRGPIYEPEGPYNNNSYLIGALRSYIFREITNSYRYQHPIKTEDESLFYPFEIVLDVYKKNVENWDTIKEQFFWGFKASYNELFFKMSVFDKNELVDWWQDYKKKIDDYLNI